MASANTLRTLVRPAIPRAPRIQPTYLVVAPFSTSNALAVTAPPAIKSRRDLPGKQTKTYKRKKIITPAKKPNPGERRAFRKRIQLSNNGALAVPGLESLEGTTLSSAENAGKVFALPNQLVDQLRTLEAFKTTQNWNLFRSPHVLVRKETVELIRRMDESLSKKESARVVLTGGRISGKSLALLQAMSHALLNEWVVISIPEGRDLTNGHTDYTPVRDTEPMQFTQPSYSLRLLQAIYKANKAVLEKLKVEKSSSLIGGLKEGATLAELAINAKEGDAAWASLNVLWSELTLPGRPPVLLALDGLSQVNNVSEYRDPSFNLVHAHDLTIVRMFFDALGSKTKLPNGGAVIAACSGDNVRMHPSQTLVLSQLEAGQAGLEVPKPDPYERKYDNRVYDALKNSYVVRLGGLSQDEARSLMEYWGASGLIRKTLNAQTVSEKWTLAGHGNVGELERASLQTMRM